MSKSIAALLATAIDATERCRRDKHQGLSLHEARIDFLMGLMPSGSGIDKGTKLDDEKSGLRKLVFQCAFHHMDEVGYYTRWTHHRIEVVPTFDGAEVTVGGSDFNSIKDHLFYVFHHALNRPLTPEEQMRWDEDTKEWAAALQVGQ